MRKLSGNWLAGRRLLGRRSDGKVLLGSRFFADRRGSASQMMMLRHLCGQLAIVSF